MDLEWLRRLDRHRNRRPVDWTTLEVPIELSAVVRIGFEPSECLLIDSLGTWTANLLEQEADSLGDYAARFARLLEVDRGRCNFCRGRNRMGSCACLSGRGGCFAIASALSSATSGRSPDTVYLATGGYALDLSVRVRRCRP